MLLKFSHKVTNHQIKKRAKDRGRHLIKTDREMGNKHIKRYFTSHAVRETQIKRMRCRCTPIRRAKSRAKPTGYRGARGAAGTPAHCW